MSDSTLSLANLYPGKVRVELAGESYLAREFQVRHLLMLDRWMARRASNPLDAIPSPADDPEPESRPKRLVAAAAVASQGLPRVGTETGQQLLATARGAILYLKVVLRHTRGIDLSTLVALVPSLSSTEWQRLNRIAWGNDPLDEVRAEIMRGEDEDDDPSPLDWEATFCGLAREYSGLTFNGFLNLYLSQLACLQRGGSPREKPLSSAAEFFAWQAASRGEKVPSSPVGNDSPDIEA